MSETPRRVTVRSPSNIAVVKYMGKDDPSVNRPANASLSMTLDRLCTWCTVEEADGLRVESWDPSILDIAQAESVLGRAVRVPVLSPKGRDRFLAHVRRVRARAPEILGLHGLASRAGSDSRGLRLAAGNTFPAASGIASSASSFSALTVAVAAIASESLEAFESEFAKNVGLRRDLAALSREGSGSSCRSLEGPWVAWEGDRASAVEWDAAFEDWVDFVLVVAGGEKEVSSSDAHLRVKESPLWHGRIQRADARVHELRRILREGDRRALARLAWDEAWEMHSLFHTSPQPFTYWVPETVAVLKFLAPFVESASAQPPVVTLDAGPNIHVLVPASEKSAWISRLRRQFPAMEILEDHCGRGASLVLEKGSH